MNIVIYRYRAAKPEDGHLRFQLHRGGTVVFFTEHWHGDVGWEVIIDVQHDTDQPREDRWFFLCNAGDNLTPLGEYADTYLQGIHESKAYCSYLYETTQLSETERQELRVRRDRYRRGRPAPEDRSRTERERDAAQARARTAALRVVEPRPQPPAAASGPQAAAEEA